ncbi:hypothetical protein ACFL6O_05680 [candidate division KSB1 bacterium]
MFKKTQAFFCHVTSQVKTRQTYYNFRILAAFPGSKIVIPGHGIPEDLDIIRHTLKLLAKHKQEAIES